jgi:hypothetical protein
MVADYQFYVSQDPSNWGTPVASGTFGTARRRRSVTSVWRRVRRHTEVTDRRRRAVVQIHAR